jgi:phenylacetic acid degradation operon negative regulatory protein
MARDAAQTLLALGEGVLSYTVDVALWLSLYMLELSMPAPMSGKEWRARINADKFLHHVNYDVIKHAIINAKRKGWLKKSRRHAWPQITEAGKKRLAAILPTYDEKRIWDGRLHLITYDIPESKRNDRALLREHLRIIGCGMLQESVWITPYNPIDMIRSFIDDHRLAGTIIISDLGKDGSIGEEDTTDLVVRVYHLDALEERYENLLHEIRDTKVIDHWMIMRYFSILRDDPQLPFALLPKWWKGDKVYQLLQPHIKKL